MIENIDPAAGLILQLIESGGIVVLLFFLVILFYRGQIVSSAVLDRVLKAQTETIRQVMKEFTDDLIQEIRRNNQSQGKRDRDRL